MVPAASTATSGTIRIRLRVLDFFIVDWFIFNENEDENEKGYKMLKKIFHNQHLEDVASLRDAITELIVNPQTTLRLSGVIKIMHLRCIVVPNANNHNFVVPIADNHNVNDYLVFVFVFVIVKFKLHR